jgi:hypothetical protein
MPNSLHARLLPSCKPNSLSLTPFALSGKWKVYETLNR